MTRRIAAVVQPARTSPHFFTVVPSLLRARQQARLWLLGMMSALALLITLVAAPVYAASTSDQLRAAAASEAEPAFLKVDEAFKPSASLIDGVVVVRFAIADGYYLYQSQFRFKADGVAFAPPEFPEGKLKHDEYLGEQIVYFGFVEIRLPKTSGPDAFDLKVSFQGCAEAGLCYTPTTRTLAIDGGAASATGADISENGSATSSPDAESITSTSTGTPVAGDAAGGELAAALGESLWAAVAFALIAGIGLTFTPCVLPMIPITVAVIGGQGAQISAARRLLLVFVYVQAMALTYAVLGVAVASAGAALQGYLQSPWLIVPSAILFVLLAFSMFGAYELQLPAALRDRLANSGQGGSLVGVVFMGALSALVVSPCISAPLAGALAFIASTGDTLRGGVALYALGVGMGLPLLIAGVGGGQLLPRAGAWMDNVKHLFGFGLVAVAIVLINRLIPASAGLALWAVFMLALSAYFGHLQTKAAWQYLLQALRYAALIYGVALVIGALSGQSNPLQPLPTLAGSSGSVEKKIDAHAGFTRIKSSADLDREIAAASAAGKTVMLDFFADWCVACFEFADYTFPDPAVQAALANTVLLQADVTANDDVDRALMDRFHILGLPSILFFDASGTEQPTRRVTGFMNAEKFAGHVQTTLTP